MLNPFNKSVFIFLSLFFWYRLFMKFLFLQFSLFYQLFLRLFLFFQFFCSLLPVIESEFIFPGRHESQIQEKKIQEYFSTTFKILALLNRFFFQMRNTDDYLPTFSENQHTRKNYIEGGKQNNIDEQISSIKSNGISQNWTFMSNIFEDPRSNSNRFKEMKQEYQDLMKMHQETLQQNRKLKREKEKLNRKNLQKEIEQLQQQNLYLRNKLTQFQSQSRNFYVEELEKNNELLVRENKRILNMIMRKVKLELYA